MCLCTYVRMFICSISRLRDIDRFVVCRLSCVVWVILVLQVYVDISILDASHIPLIERLYELSRRELLARNIPWLNEQNIDELASAGFNYPVSVCIYMYMHMHMYMCSRVRT